MRTHNLPRLRSFVTLFSGSFQADMDYAPHSPLLPTTFVKLVRNCTTRGDTRVCPTQALATGMCRTQRLVFFWSYFLYFFVTHAALITRVSPSSHLINVSALDKHSASGH